MKGRVVLCPNPQRDAGLEVTKRVCEMLKNAGEEPLVCQLFEKSGAAVAVDFAERRELEAALPEARLLVTFGGDGTLLYAARAAADMGVPILGVNLGTKGFIAEIERDGLSGILKAASGEFETERRMMLDVKIERGGSVIFSDRALNEVVVSGIARVVDISVFADGHRTLRFSGDGVIVATPTGTTAYSMAAGGPIAEPTAENLIITPICAHALFARAFVLSPEREVTVKTGRLTGRRAYASVDGTDAISLREGDVVTVVKSASYTRMVKAADDSFYEKVYRKLGER